MPTGLYAHRHSRARPTASLKQKAPGTCGTGGFYMGWLMGLEPTTTGITIQGSTD